MSEYNEQHMTVCTLSGQLVKVVRRIPASGERVTIADCYWRDPNTGDLYDVDVITGKATLIFRAVQ